MNKEKTIERPAEKRLENGQSPRPMPQPSNEKATTTEDKPKTKESK